MFSMLLSSRGRLRVLGWVVACTLAASFVSAQKPAVRIRADVNNSAMTTLKGTRLLAEPQERDAGRMPSNTKLNGVSIVFSRSAAQQTALEKLLAAQQDPASPEFHRWLTPEQFGARFGMASADIEKVQRWLEQQGFTIERVARSQNMIRFSGTVGQLEQTFRTELHFYNAAGEQHFAPSTALSVPAAMAPTIQAIRNLNNFRPRPMHVKPRGAFTSGQSGNNFFAPGDIALTYDINPLYSAGVDGTGQSITIVGQSAIDPKDIENFQNAAGLHKKDPVMVIVPGSGSSTIVAGVEGESDLDVEWSGAIAKGATVYFV